MKKAYKQRIDELTNDGVEMQEEMENAIQEHDAKLSGVNHELSTVRTKAQNYWAELQQLRSKSLKQEELRQVEIKLMEDSVKASKKQTKTKEEEIVNLQKELKLVKEKAMRLEEKTLQMEKVCEDTEMDAAMLVDDLNKKLVKAAEQQGKIEEEKSAIMTESRKAIEALERKITIVETEFSTLKKELASRSKQLSERDATIASLTKVKMAQDENVETWKNELDMLCNAYESCKIEHASNVKKIRGDYEQFKIKAQKDASTFQKDYDSLQSLAAETETKLEQRSSELLETRKALEDRTTVLSEMVKCQKVTEQELTYESKQKQKGFGSF